VREHAADVEHAALRLSKRGQERADEHQGRPQIDGDHAVEEGRVCVVDVGPRRQGRVVDERVEPAEAGRGGGGELRRAPLVGQVARQERGAVRPELPPQALAACRVAAVEDDAGPLLHEASRHRGADAGGAAGDQDDALVQSHGLAHAAETAR
jgi:hypothetical protein